MTVKFGPPLVFYMWIIFKCNFTKYFRIGRNIYIYIYNIPKKQNLLIVFPLRLNNFDKIFPSELALTKDLLPSVNEYNNLHDLKT